MKTEKLTPTKLQFLNATELRRLDRIFIIVPKNHPGETLAVLIPWEEYLRLLGEKNAS